MHYTGSIVINWDCSKSVMHDLMHVPTPSSHAHPHTPSSYTCSTSYSLVPMEQYRPMMDMVIALTIGTKMAL